MVELGVNMVDNFMGVIIMIEKCERLINTKLRKQSNNMSIAIKNKISRKKTLKWVTWAFIKIDWLLLENGHTKILLRM